ncbi:PhnE/PtxC family ABC transporter permease [Raoultibacter phocaeensis]|uniref:PhnE/PtxC family ABC transporter permease n=1 Tax=Raoultibacter phocaeensis TaxID=2479841 RepID=UPI0021068717|nr:ABC transporter permease subunit [Raoultibacter phocaeensis]
MAFAYAGAGAIDAAMSSQGIIGEAGERFFRKRSLFVVGLFLLFVGLNALAGSYVGFDPVASIVDIPAGIVWMATNFIPTADSFAKLGQILSSLGSTILVSIAASCTAALIAFVFAVLGSRSVGIGGPVSVVVRGIASLFRNIPVVAWAFVLLFSFKQSEFTGFFALFLTSFGYLTRCYLESIDEVSAGAVEALRATGAGYAQIVVQAVIPMTITSVISWVLYMIETNIRDATLIGILTGTGIGFLFDLFYKSFRYDVAGLVILAIVVAVIACEALSNYVRRQII